MATDVDAKLLRQTKFPPEFNQKVDMKKVNLEVMKKWIAGKISEILGSEDDVVIELCFGLLEGSRFPEIKRLQIQLTGFLDKDTARFCKELWSLCLSAQSNPQGVPKELLEAKKMELLQEKVLMRKKRLRKRVENVSRRELENVKSRVYGSGSAGTAVAESMTVAADAEAVSSDAVGLGAPALLDVARSIIAARHLVVRWTRTSLLVVEVGGATEMTDLSGIVHQETARYQYPGLAHAPARALVLPHLIYAAEEATRSQDPVEIGLDRGPESILDVFPVLEAEGEGFQVVVIREHAPFLLLKRLAHVHLEDPGGSDLPQFHPAAVPRLLFLGTIVAAGENTIDVDVYPDHDQDLVLWSQVVDTLEEHIVKVV
ncbi:hypothetical protein GP486_003902 [Trichoglossum hirsutum]|uniref:PWI domain-containing protein n=1 Tax=Trichoglossum hirsutum TaxID=265104 RepID=A0A9P8RQ00_9PEZI|nr:hypothetical protein GP486_003902 [Trichoglossum hirsutum]